MINNPISRGHLKNGNPPGDPSIAPRCGAKTRAGAPCRQPAMRNGRCRLHGGKSPGAPRGKRNGNYRHGLRTIEAIAEKREALRVRRLILTGDSRAPPAFSAVDESAVTKLTIAAPCSKWMRFSRPATQEHQAKPHAG
jgi:hypothetical protein